MTRRAHPTFLTLTLTLLVATAAAAQDTASDPRFDVDFELGVYSAYVWRGQALTNGGVFQPSITAAHAGGFSLNAWGNLDLANDNDLSGDFQETDVTLSYAFGSETISAEVGLIEYLFPNEVGPGTREVYASVGFGGPLSPTVAVYYDVDEVDGVYATLGVEYGRSLSPKLSVAVALSAGWADDAFAQGYGGRAAGFYDGLVSLGLSYESAIGTVGVMVGYTDTLDDAALPQQDVDLFGGVSVAFRF